MQGWYGAGDRGSGFEGRVAPSGFDRSSILQYHARSFSRFIGLRCSAGRAYLYLSVYLSRREAHLARRRVACGQVHAARPCLLR